MSPLEQELLPLLHLPEQEHLPPYAYPSKSTFPFLHQPEQEHLPWELVARDVDGRDNAKQGVDWYSHGGQHQGHLDLHAGAVQKK